MLYYINDILIPIDDFRIFAAAIQKRHELGLSPQIRVVQTAGDQDGDEPPVMRLYGDPKEFVTPHDPACECGWE